MSTDTYALFALTITDEAAHEDYIAGAIESFADTGVELVFATDDLVPLEGAVPAERLVLLKFPSEDAARGWYESEAYTKVKPLRLESADTAFGALIRTAAPGA